MWQQLNAAASAAGTGAVTPPLPVGWAAGDVALLICESNPAEPVAAPVGWTEVTGSPVIQSTSAATRLTVFWRELTATETNPVPIADPGDHIVSYIICIRGADLSGSVITATNTAAPAASTTFTAPSLAVTENDYVVAIVASGRDDNAWPVLSSSADPAQITIENRFGISNNAGGGGGFGVISGPAEATGTIDSITGSLVASLAPAMMTLALSPDPAGVGHVEINKGYQGFVVDLQPPNTVAVAKGYQGFVIDTEGDPLPEPAIYTESVVEGLGSSAAPALLRRVYGVAAGSLGLAAEVSTYMAPKVYTAEIVEGLGTVGVAYGSIPAEVSEVTVVEGLGFSLSQHASYGVYAETVVESAGFSVTVSAGVGSVDVSELQTFLIGDQVDAYLISAGAQEAAITETLKALDFNTTSKAYPVTGAEGLALGGAIFTTDGKWLRERVRVRGVLAGTAYYNIKAVERIRVRDSVVIAFELLVTDGFELSDLTSTLLGVQVRDRVRIVTVMAGMRVRGVIVDERLRISDTLLRHIMASVVEGVEFGDTLATFTSRVAHLIEQLELADAATPQLLLHITTRERVSVSAQQLLTMLYSGHVLEGVEIGGGFVGPDGEFTTWAMNVENGAVSEYTNYPFNSFARIGNRYLAAASDGLYELLGDDDAGEDIITTLRGGFMQFGGVRLSRLKAAYLAVRGDGDFVLRIETAEGQTYNYAVEARSMRTTKVHMGKGQRARYFAFELTSSGQDFDFESLEFVPIVVQRRV